MTLFRLLLVGALGILPGSYDINQSTNEAEITGFFRSYDQAYNAKDLTRLASFYHPAVTVFEGRTVDQGWAAYRDHHLGKELRSFQNLKWSHSNLRIHSLGSVSAYVTADYSIGYVLDGRPIQSEGLATHVLVKESGGWRIRHTHTSVRR